MEGSRKCEGEIEKTAFHADSRSRLRATETKVRSRFKDYLNVIYLYVNGRLLQALALKGTWEIPDTRSLPASAISCV